MTPVSFELRELFHLIFLRQIAQRLAGRSYAVKGGICLRFFHRSPRLSEDIDLDVGFQLPVKTLQNAVDTVLKAKVLHSTLASRGIIKMETSKPKQTETVQRWKIGLLMGESRLKTKIEFSRRSKKVEFVSGVPDKDILRQHNQPLFASQYYEGVSMTVQKIAALASPGRNAARDLFDLHHLLSFLKTDPIAVAKKVSLDFLRGAQAKIDSYDYEDFAQQVLPYLTGELMALYSNSAAFEAMKAETIERLMEIKNGSPRN